MKLAMFDIDWTIIKPCNGRTFPKDRYDWQWLNDSVKNSIQNYEKLGYTIAMISNQSKIWKCIMIDNIIDSLELSNKPIKIISMDKKTHNTDHITTSLQVFFTLLYQLSIHIKISSDHEINWSIVPYDMTKDSIGPYNIRMIEENDETSWRGAINCIASNLRWLSTVL